MEKGVHIESAANKLEMLSNLLFGNLCRNTSLPVAAGNFSAPACHLPVGFGRYFFTAVYLQTIIVFIFSKAIVYLKPFADSQHDSRRCIQGTDIGICRNPAVCNHLCPDFILQPVWNLIYNSSGISPMYSLWLRVIPVDLACQKPYNKTADCISMCIDRDLDWGDFFGNFVSGKIAAVHNFIFIWKIKQAHGNWRKNKENLQIVIFPDLLFDL